jgi:serine/threonine protein kinase
MEYASGGELFNKITTTGRIAENEAKKLFAQVVSAVQFMVGFLRKIFLFII